MDWKTTRIGDVIGGLFDGPHATPKEATSGPVFLGIKNITDDGFMDLSSIRHIDPDDFPTWTKRVVPREGDIVFTYEATLNRYAIIPMGFVGCLGRRMALIRPDDQKAIGKFLHYYFFGTEWRKVIDANTLRGATVDRIPLTTFPNFPVRLPPIPTQRRIAEILSAYDDLIEVNTRRIKALEEMARRTYEEWFVRERNNLQTNQNEWIWTTLGEYCQRVGGSIQTGPFGSQLHQSDYAEAGIPVVMPKNIIDGRIDQVSCAKIPSQLAQGLKRHALAPGDIVFARRGDIGRKARVRRNDTGVLCGTGCLKVTFQSPLAASHYVSSYFDEQETIEALAGRAIGATMPNLNTQILAEMPFPIPPFDRLLEFERVSEENDLLASTLARQNTNLRTQRDLLLPRLVSGAIDVSEVEPILEVAAE
jgi:type I restriction enzyme S subunit